KSIRTTHLGLDPEQYRPLDKPIARRALGIPADRFVIGFACSDFSDERKGARLLLEAVAASRQPATLLTSSSGRWPSAGNPAACRAYLGCSTGCHSTRPSGRPWVLRRGSVSSIISQM